MDAKSDDEMTSRDWRRCMESVQNGDKKAYAKVFYFFAPKLKFFAYKHLNNEQSALEIVQETMAIVWHKASLFDAQKSALPTWIFTIARNQCFDLLRKQNNKSSLVLADDIWSQDYCPPDLIHIYTPEHDRFKQQVILSLNTLPEPQKEVLEAVYIGEMQHQEVADLLNIPLGTVKSRLRLGIEKLKHTIGDDRR